MKGRHLYVEDPLSGWCVSVQQSASWGPMAWYGQVHHGSSTYDGGTYAWTEAGCRRKVLRRMRRLARAAHRAAETRTITRFE